MNIKFGLILILFVLGNHAFSQVAGKTYKQRISGQKIYNKDTGERISDEELQELIKINPNIMLEPCINKYGKVESFEVDPKRTSRALQRDVSMRSQKGEQFPPFVMKTIEDVVLDLEKLNGKNVLVQFQLSFTLPFFRESTLAEFSNLCSQLKSTTDIEAIVVTESSKQELLNSIEPEKYEVNIVPNGRNFSQKYLVVDFPTIVLIDSNGKLVGYYNQTETAMLKSDIKNL